MIDKEFFYISSENVSNIIESQEQRFYGYVFNEGSLFHYKKKLPDLSSLWKSYELNCGVFAAFFVNNDEIFIFTDPLSQYPVFFSENQGRFCITNDFYKAASFSGRGINSEAIFDCLTYFSPLKNETIACSVKTISEYQYIRVSMKKGHAEFCIDTFEKDAMTTSSYNELMELCLERMQHRAKAVLAEHKPVIHLTGGLDSRLSFAAFLSVSGGEGFSVFSFGDGKSADRFIFEKLVEKYRLETGSVVLSGGKPKTYNDLHFCAKAFNGLKYTNQTNYKVNWRPEHAEVTGYFSGGLIKGFGTYFKKGKFSPFEYARKVSALPGFVFNSTAYRLYEELSSVVLKDKNYSARFNYIYRNNRSKAHFGQHSAVNNKGHVSIDLLYDPLLVMLYEKCTIDEVYKNEGALILELIRGLGGDSLAFYPVADRVLPNYLGEDYSQYNDGFNCFNKLKFEAVNDLSKLNVLGDLYEKRDESDLISLDRYESFWKKYPFLHLCFLDGMKGPRTSVEKDAVISLMGVLDFLEESK
ncbi:hypothetical protein [Halomonas sp. DWK9]|uniref:hypothetical protein n=1 Tax=Halomonas sp. DWK9 TaxID=3060155 RepID=UPI00287F6D88|nr:hypothetical protein [Halomonas sp. DWK9]